MINCVICNIEFKPKNETVATCSDKCYLKNYRIMKGLAFKQEQRNCIICNTEFTATKNNHVTCSKQCLAKKGNNKLIADKNAKAIAGIEHEVPVCVICGYKARALHSHVLNHHSLSVQQYKDKFNLNDSDLYHHSYLTQLSEQVQGENNPAYNHGGKLSALSKKFIKYKDLSNDEIETERYSIAKKIADTREENETNTTRIEYYLNKGLNIDEANEALSLRQTTFSLEICIEKHGVEEGTRIWQERQYKWSSNYKKTNFSRISQTLFWNIVNTIGDDENDRKYWFATCIDNGINNEKSIKLNNGSVVKPDFLDVKNNIIIEFYGDYWHDQNERGNQERDKKREDSIIDSGYKLITILEREYRKFPNTVLNYCIEELTTKIT